MLGFIVDTQTNAKSACDIFDGVPALKPSCSCQAWKSKQKHTEKSKGKGKHNEETGRKRKKQEKTEGAAGHDSR